ncbi:MAG TPA: response regulator, partial [Hyphomicrobiaceae bacterium]
MAAKILIIEDESALVVLLRYNLEAEGHEVSVALTGEEAKLVLEEERPDLVILDWMLPGLSGIEICRQIRARPETRD